MVDDQSRKETVQAGLSWAFALPVQVLPQLLHMLTLSMLGIYMAQTKSIASKKTTYPGV